MLFLLFILFILNSTSIRIESQERFQPRSLVLQCLTHVSKDPLQIATLPEELKIAATILAKKKGNIDKALLEAVTIRACCWADLKKIEKRTAHIIPHLITPPINEHILSSFTFFGIVPLLKGGANVHVESKMGQSIIEIAQDHEDEPLKRLIWEHKTNGKPIKFRNHDM
jgi:hypothetical protein